MAETNKNNLYLLPIYITSKYKVNYEKKKQ